MVMDKVTAILIVYSLWSATAAGAVTVSGTIQGDCCGVGATLQDCGALTDPNVPGTCPIIAGSGFSVKAFLMTSAGADCCGLPACGRCLIRYEIDFDTPFGAAPTTQATAGDPTTTCATSNVTVGSFSIGCNSGFGSFVPPHDLNITATGLAAPTPTAELGPMPVT
jgi:hypothetical protein